MQIQKGITSVVVESRMGAVACFSHRPVSHPRSSNRACRFPAPDFPTGLTAKHTTAGRSLQVSSDDTSARGGLPHLPIRPSR